MKKFLSIISSLSILINSFFAPLTVIAQDFSPTSIQSEPSPEATSTDTPTVEPTSTPIETVTPNPTIEPEPTVETSPESVQSNEPIIISSPTPEVLSESKEDISLKAVILENTNSETIEEFDFSSNEYSSATLITDKADYAPTDTVLITGSGFLGNKEYGIEITSETGNFKFSDKVTSDESGGLFYAYQLDGTYRPNYKVEIKDGSLIVSVVTFTDGPESANLDQCRNGTSSTPNNCIVIVGGQGWTNGNAGSSNSHFVEGFSVPYRAVMNNLPTNGTSITLDLGYDIKNSGKHAIDYLTSYNRLESHVPFGHSAEVINPISGVTISTSTLTTYAIPAPDSTGSPVSGQPTTSFNNLPANEKLMTLYGGTISNVSYVSQGSLTGAQSSSVVRITFTADSSTAVLAWGGHLASRLDWGFDLGQPRSAGGINGSSYHMRLENWNLGNLGNTDRSLSTDAVIPPGNLTIVKNVVPDDSGATLWNFTTTGPNSYLHNTSNLVDGGQDILSVAPGTYVITETTDSRYLTSVSCNTGESGSSNVSVTIDSNESAVCTFTNLLRYGTVVVHKDVQGPNGEAVVDTSSNFSVELDGANTQNITDGGSVTYNDVSSGSHTITESVIPGGYGLYGISTTQGNSGNTSGLTFSVAAGLTTHVYVTNRQLAGKLVVSKVTIPNNTQEVFSITASGGTISGTETRNISTGSDVTYDVYAGTYTVTEAQKTGWKETENTCTNVVVGLGETKTCTITNTQQGKIVIKKETTPDGDSQVFNFVSSYKTSGFSLSDGQTNDSGFLTPGTYSVSENGIADWTLSSSSCDDGSSIDAINLSAGETVTCTFNNTKLGKIIIEKQTLPDGSNQSFEFVPSYGTNFNLNDNQTNESIYLLPGTYSVTETTVPGWDTVASCDDQSLPSGINLSAGETVRCTFVNTQRGNISGYKFESQYGSPDSGLTGILGWTIELYSCTTSAFTSCSVTPIATTSTISDGSYSFLNLIPGYYQIKEVLQNGWTNITSLFKDVSLDPGETDRENNFVNFEKATIIVHKNVLDEFGNEVDDSEVFQVEIDGTNTKDISEGNNAIYSNLIPGTYSISELTVPDGYEFVSITNGGVVTVESGQTHNVYVVNKQLPGSITIIKDAQPNAAFNFGFTGDLGSFTLDDDANPTYSNTITFPNLGAGTYSVTENPYTTWTLTNLICVDPDQGTVVDVDSRNATIDLDFGENITCTFTNSRRPKINVIKHVINDNGGTKVAGDFTINVTGDNPSKTTFLGNEAGTWVYFDPGSYSIDEIEQTGYTKTLSANCSGTLSYGNSRTCTITNDDQPGTLIIRKVINGGSKVYEDFGFRVNDDKTTYFESDGQNDLAVDSGYYTIVEDTADGYSTIYDNCSEVFVPNGGSQTCTITNTRNQGEIIIKKIIDEDGDLINTTDDQTLGVGWGMDVDGIAGDVDNPTAGSTDSNSEYKTGKIKTGFYDASETQQDDYDFISASCSDRSIVNNINLEKDEVVTCTFYNTPNGTIHGYKWNDLNGNATDLFEQEDKLGNWTINLFAWNDEDDDYTDLIKTTLTDNNPGSDFGWYWFTHLFPGIYKVCEGKQAGWQQTYPAGNGCHLVTIPDTNPNEFPEMENYVAESPTYNFGNMEDDPSIVITKSNDKSGGASINDEVTYTLIVTNTGNLNLSDVKIKDAFPGGFSYVSGSSYLNGVLISDPNISGGLLTWDIGDLNKNGEAKLTYKLKISDNVVKGGSYKNIATCSAFYGSLQTEEITFLTRINLISRKEIECNIADSTVAIGTSNNYGGNLNGQVLGASTEQLPATGNPTWLLAFALLGLTTGFVLRRKHAKS